MEELILDRPEDYVSVPVSTIFPDRDMKTAFYIRRDTDEAFRLYRGAEYPFSQEDIDTLVEQGVHHLYVTAEEHHRYQQYLREALPDIVGDETMSPVARFDSLNSVVRDVLMDVFKSRDVSETVSKAGELGSLTVDLVTRDDFVAADLLKVLRHDFHTFTHSANVGYYCVFLAKHLGISDKADLDAIASGALMHDLGKLDVPDAILTKPGRLSPDEFEVIKRHPTDGFLQLKDRDDVSFGQLMMVYQHHEWMNGNGYPVGVTGEEIHPWGKICAVVDVFEALTSSRPYRGPMASSRALQIMERESGDHFDEEMLQCWMTIITNN